MRILLRPPSGAPRSGKQAHVQALAGRRRQKLPANAADRLETRRAGSAMWKKY